MIRNNKEMKNQKVPETSNAFSKTGSFSITCNYSTVLARQDIPIKETKYISNLYTFNNFDLTFITLIRTNTTVELMLAGINMFWARFKPWPDISDMR